MTDLKKPFKYIKYYELITMIHLLLIEKNINSTCSNCPNQILQICMYPITTEPDSV